MRGEVQATAGMAVQLSTRVPSKPTLRCCIAGLGTLDEIINGYLGSCYVRQRSSSVGVPTPYVVSAALRDQTNSATCPTIPGSCWWEAICFTITLPTITPSATFDTRAASSGVATPNPTATGAVETFRSFPPFSWTSPAFLNFDPVMPVRHGIRSCSVRQLASENSWTLSTPALCFHTDLVPI